MAHEIAQTHRVQPQTVSGGDLDPSEVEPSLHERAGGVVLEGAKAMGFGGWAQGAWGGGSKNVSGGPSEKKREAFVGVETCIGTGFLGG